VAAGCGSFIAGDDMSPWLLLEQCYLFQMPGVKHRLHSFGGRLLMTHEMFCRCHERIYGCGLKVGGNLSGIQ